MEANDCALLDRLDEVFRDLLAGSRSGVIAAIWQGVARINRFQGEFSRMFNSMAAGLKHTLA